MVYKPLEIPLDMVDIYNYKKRLDRIENIISKSEEISKINKKDISLFREECFANGIGYARIIRYLYCLRDLSIWLNRSFSAAKIEDIKRLVAKIETDDKYAPRTKIEYKATLKKFYKFLKKNDNPEETSWIKLNLKKHNDKLPTELLTEEDIMNMINLTTNVRDRAIIISLYESGCRVGEFIKLKIKDVTFDKYGCLLDVTGKTGGRRIRIIASAPYLMEWLNKHPNKDDSNSFLWLKHKSLTMLGYASLRKLLAVAGKRAGIKKKFNPHNFRHSRATHLANKLTEQQLKLFFGWTRSSDMASVYVHLSGRDVNDSILNLYGIKEEKEKRNGIQIRIIRCFKCNYENEPTNKFCKMCGIPLDQEEAQKLIKQDTDRQQADEIMNKLVKDPEILELIRKKINL